MDVRDRSISAGEKNFGLIASSNLGLIALEEGDFVHAHAYLEESMAAARALDDKDSMAWRLAELGNAYYLEGKSQEFKDRYGKCFSMGKDLRIFAKRDLLLLALDPLHTEKPENTVRLLGALHEFEKESARPIAPLLKRNYDRAEVHTRKVLGDEAFESNFAEGQKVSLDKALELAGRTVEEM